MTELAHLTTPSSPDVPCARFLITSMGLKNNEKTIYNSATDLHSTYSLDPGSPALRSPISMTVGDGGGDGGDRVVEWGLGSAGQSEPKATGGSGGGRFQTEVGGGGEVSAAVILQAGGGGGGVKGVLSCYAPSSLSLMACVELRLCDAATVVDVYRLIQYDMSGAQF
ncbi:hypothetical protein ACFE04_011889 [Oxalis oulophora]